MKAATVKKLFAVSALLLCAGLLSGCSDPITEPGLAGLRLMDQRSARTKILSEMTEEECVEFIISKGVAIPDDFIDHPQLGAFVKSDIKAAELNPNLPPAYSWDVSYKFAKSIRTVVNEYYGTTRSYSASTRSPHTLDDSKVLTKNGDWGSSGGFWHYDWSGYNCYSYAIGKIENWYNPGNFANTGSFIARNPVYDLALIVKADLEKLTSSPVQITNIAPNTSTLQPQQKLICVRKGVRDYHFMRYIKNDGWYHKPGEFAPLKYNYKTIDIDWEKTWTDERSANGSEYAAALFYNSEIYYIIYDDWNPQTTVTADTIPLRAPVAGRPPQTRVVTHQYTGTVTWADSYGTPLGSNQTFAAGTSYTAVINLDAAVNFTLQGLPSNFFTVFGASSASFNSATGVLTVVFPPAKTAVGDFDVLFMGTEYNGNSIIAKEGQIGIFTLYTDDTWTLEEAGFYSYYLNDIMLFPSLNVEHCLRWNIPMSITSYLAQVDMTANIELAVRYPIGNQGGVEYLEYALVLEVSGDEAKIIWRDQTVNRLLSFEDYRYMPAITVPVSGSLILTSSFYDGDGTENNPFLIENVKYLQRINMHDSDTTYFKLINDIDISTAWALSVQLPLPPFYGHFDGNGKTISSLSGDSSLTINGGLGLFEENHGTIKNLNVDVNINSVECDQYVGTIAAVNYGIIENCRVSGDYFSVYQINSNIGGITGFNTETGKILNCTNNVALNWIWSTVGGIAGLNAGAIEDCINAGFISYYYNYGENRSVGGIAGNNIGNIKNCTNENFAISFERSSSKAPTVFPNTTISNMIADMEAKAKNYKIEPKIHFTGERSRLVSQNINSSYVYTGGIAGINTGMIENSENNEMASHSGNRFAFVGGIAGFNEGQIVASKNNGEVFNYATVGGIVGDNYGNISGNENHGQVYFIFLNANGNAGGIAGMHNGGSISSCGNYGLIEYLGFQNDSTVLQPAMGQIIGYHVSGNLINNNILSGSVNPGNLTTVNGFNQALYVSNGAVGRAF